MKAIAPCRRIAAGRQGDVALDGQGLVRKAEGLEALQALGHGGQPVAQDVEDGHAALGAACQEHAAAMAAAQDAGEQGGQAHVGAAQQLQKVIACLSHEGDQGHAVAAHQQAHRHGAAVDAQIGGAGARGHGCPAFREGLAADGGRLLGRIGGGAAGCGEQGTFVQRGPRTGQGQQGAGQQGLEMAHAVMSLIRG